MHFKKILALSIFLAVAAFGLYGFNALINSPIAPAQAAAPTLVPTPAVIQRAGMLTLANAGGGPDNAVTMAVEIKPAAELPSRAPDAAGVYGSREGNTLTLDSFRVDTAGGQGISVFGGAISGSTASAQAGTVVMSSGSVIVTAPGADGQVPPPEAGSAPMIIHSQSADGQSSLTITGAAPDGGPTTIMVGPGQPGQAISRKVTVTDATRVYRDVTPMPQMTSGTQTIQQTLAAGSLDDLTGNSMVTVWGHMDGEQLVADTILYQVPPALPALPVK